RVLGWRGALWNRYASKGDSGSGANSRPLPSRRGNVRRYLLRRVAAFVATLFFVSLIVFVVVRVLPGDPALIIMGTEGSPEAAARLREAMGLNRPVAVQYAH